jgi:transposase
LRPGLPEGRTHDYKRNGTTNLYAALQIATGEVFTDCQPRHRSQEFLAFLRQIDRAYPDGELHIVLDNSSTHTTPEVKSWLARHPRIHFHFTPTGASWMNMVESWFSILTRQQVRRGSYDTVAELIAAIEHFVATWNDRARPFTWTKSADEIIAKTTKKQATSETEH